MFHYFLHDGNVRFHFDAAYALSRLVLNLKMQGTEKGGWLLEGERGRIEMQGRRACKNEATARVRNMQPYSSTQTSQTIGELAIIHMHFYQNYVNIWNVH